MSQDQLEMVGRLFNDDDNDKTFNYMDLMQIAKRRHKHVLLAQEGEGKSDSIVRITVSVRILCCV